MEEPLIEKREKEGKRGTREREKENDGGTKTEDRAE